MSHCEAQLCGSYQNSAEVGLPLQMLFAKSLGNISLKDREVADPATITYVLQRL